MLKPNDLELIEKTNVLRIDTEKVTFASRISQHYWEVILSNFTAGGLKCQILKVYCNI